MLNSRWLRVWAPSLVRQYPSARLLSQLGLSWSPAVPRANIFYSAQGTPWGFDFLHENAGSGGQRGRRAAWIGLLAALGLGAWGTRARAIARREVSLSEFVEDWVKKGRISHVEISDGNFLQSWLGSESPGQPIDDGGNSGEVKERASKTPGPIVYLGKDSTEIVRKLEEHGCGVRYRKEVSWPSLGYLLMALYLGSLVWRGVRSGMAPGVGPGPTSNANMFEAAAPTTRFKDVAGLGEAKRELSELASFLRAPGRYARVGARLPRGALLSGPPGTGKTLLARALAGEARVPLFAASGADFAEVYVGVGAARVRQLFSRARARAPCVVFIDELDALGAARGAPGAAERDSTLNQLLVEMDGFERNNGVLVIGATNRPDSLDAALLRAGRFDRRITLRAPSKQQREEIAQVHLRGVKCEKEEGLAQRAALLTTGQAGAEIQALVNEAAMGAARRGKTRIDGAELERAAERAFGAPDRALLTQMGRAERRQIAYHEAGHAVIAWALSTRGLESGGMEVQPEIISKEMNPIYMSDAKGGQNDGLNIYGKDEGFVNIDQVESTIKGQLEATPKCSGLQAETGLKTAATENKLSNQELPPPLINKTFKLLKLSIIPRTNGSLGYTQQYKAETALITKLGLKEQICVLLGGRSAETLFMRDLSGGATDDLSRAEALAARAGAALGFAAPRSVLEKHARGRAGALGDALDVQAGALLQSQAKRADAILFKYRHLVYALSDALMKYLTLNTSYIHYLLDNTQKGYLPSW